MKQFALLLVFIFVFSYARSETYKLNITFIVKNDTTATKSVSLTDYTITYKEKDAKKEEIAPIKREKGLRLDLDLNKEYIFSFTKLGYVMKKVLVDTKVPDKREKEKFNKMICIVNLEKAPIEVILANSKPVVKIYYHPGKANFDFDSTYTFTSMDKELIKKRDKIFNHAWWQLHDGNYKGALESFANMLLKNPQDIAALYNHGKAAYKLNDKKTACADWSAIKALNKEYADSLLKDYCTSENP